MSRKRYTAEEAAELLTADNDPAGKSRKRGNNFRKFFCRINHIRLLYLHAKLQLKAIRR